MKYPQNLKRHLREVHSSVRMLCPLVVCDFVTKRMERLKTHWNQAHSHLRFPMIRNQNKYTYLTIELTDDSSSDGEVCVLYSLKFNITNVSNDKLFFIVRRSIVYVYKTIAVN